MNHTFKIDPYFSFSGKVIKNERDEIAIGISLFVTLGYEYRKQIDTVRALNSLFFDQAIGPCLQYIRLSKEKAKLFSVELFPLSCGITSLKNLSLSPNIQLNVYLRD